MDPDQFELHVLQNMHRIRLWSELHHIDDVALLPWGQVWTDVKAGLNWDRMDLHVQLEIDQAFGQAKLRLEGEPVLRPEGWDRNLAWARH